MYRNFSKLDIESVLDIVKYRNSFACSALFRSGYFDCKDSSPHNFTILILDAISLSSWELYQLPCMLDVYSYLWHLFKSVCLVVEFWLPRTQRSAWSLVGMRGIVGCQATAGTFSSFCQNPFYSTAGQSRPRPRSRNCSADPSQIPLLPLRPSRVEEDS